MSLSSSSSYESADCMFGEAPHASNNPFIPLQIEEEHFTTFGEQSNEVSTQTELSNEEPLNEALSFLINWIGLLSLLMNWLRTTRNWMKDHNKSVISIVAAIFIVIIFFGIFLADLFDASNEIGSSSVSIRLEDRTPSQLSTISFVHFEHSSEEKSTSQLITNPTYFFKEEIISQPIEETTQQTTQSSEKNMISQSKRFEQTYVSRISFKEETTEMMTSRKINSDGIWNPL